MHPSDILNIMFEKEIYRMQQAETKVGAAVEKCTPKEPHVDRRGYMYKKVADNLFLCTACNMTNPTRIGIVCHFGARHSDVLNGAHYVFTYGGSMTLQAFKKLHQ